MCRTIIVSILLSDDSSISNCFVTFAERDCIGVRNKSSNGKYGNFYVWHTYQQIGDRIINFTCGLRSIGINPRDFVSIYSNNSLGNICKLFSNL